MKVNKELDRLEKMVEYYARLTKRDLETTIGCGAEQLAGRIDAYETVLLEIRKLKEEH